MKLNVKVTSLGELAQDMMDSGIMIIFNDNAPAELAEISVLHTIAELSEDVVPGDTVTIAGNRFEVLDVGDEANKTLAQLGHCTLKFEGDKVELPGEICLGGGDMPSVKSGDLITIE